MSTETWDVVIIGAGPAGSVSAALLAKRGWRVLLLERSRWPREKVCGGCINAAAISMLRASGIGIPPMSSTKGYDAHTTFLQSPLNKFTLSAGTQRLSLSLPEGLSIPRATLDAHLVNEAIHRGCTFQHSTTATLLPSDETKDYRTLRITTDNRAQLIHTKIILACDGISGSSLDLEPWAKWTISPTSYFGVSTTLHNAGNLAAPATIAMHVGAGGYVGTAKYRDGRTHLAAALDSAHCRSTGGPAQLVTHILQQCSINIPDELHSAKFQGTNLLTRHRKSLGGHRVLAVGDACGYVEPFTGEGIAWAIRSAREVTTLLNSPQQWPPNLPTLWKQRHRATLGKQQHLCRILRKTLRYHSLTKLALTTATLFPAISKSLAHHIGQPSSATIPNLNLQGVAE